MKAWGIRAFGGPELIEPLEMPVPVPGEHDVLVEVYATAMNPVDVKMRTNGLGQARTYPLVMGYDVSGVVRQAGRRVTGVKPGDEVYCCGSVARPGADAEYVCLDARTVARKPANLTHAQAAAIPLAMETAWESLYERCNVQPSEWVLIQAGAGGVGHFAIQLARLRGCRVIATASSEESMELCRRLGADVVINYRTWDVAAEVRRATDGRLCPAVLNTLDDRTIDSSLESLAVDGRLVALVLLEAPGVIARLRAKNATLHMEFVLTPMLFGVRLEARGRMLAEVTRLVEEGKLSAHVSRVMDIGELAEAHRLQESGHVVGKIVLKVKG